METYCTRPDCSQPINHFPELDDLSKLKTTQQKHCDACGMPQILAGRYIPQRLLGKGGFGAAYLACDRYTPKLRQCVVKQFQPSDTFNEKTLKIAEDLFTREAEVLETLGNEHPQIPQLYAFFPLLLPEEGDEAGEEKQFFYIVQEFIDGETLEQEVQKKGKFNEAEVVEILKEMLKVLQFVHDHNSIHRDIKPSNIMRDRAGKLYLLDFGAVKRVTGAATTTNHSTGIYSLGFAPPEQMQGRQVYPSTDLYALAATCLRLLTGKAIQDLYDSYNNQWQWRQEANQVSEKLAGILERMLCATPKDRFASAQAILKVLDEKTILKAEEISEMEPSEEGAFSQPADWRSLLSFSKEEAETEEKPTEIETSTDQSWRDLLSLSEESSENYPEDSSISELSEEISAAQVFESQETAFQEETPNQNQHQPDSSTPLPQNNPNEVSPLPKPQSEAPPPVRQTPRFALWELLASAGFTGLEGALLLIALASVFGGVSGISIGLWGMSMGGLVYAQWKRFIEKIDFLIIGAITLAVVALIPPLHSVHGITAVMVIIWAFTVSAGAIAFAALFGLIYRLLSRSK